MTLRALWDVIDFLHERHVIGIIYLFSMLSLISLFRLKLQKFLNTKLTSLLSKHCHQNTLLFLAHWFTIRLTMYGNNATHVRNLDARPTLVLVKVFPKQKIFCSSSKRIIRIHLAKNNHQRIYTGAIISRLFSKINYSVGQASLLSFMK